MLEFQTFEHEHDVRNGVLAYIRVSSPDQAERRASLSEQRRKISAHFEGRLGLTILDWYVDEGLSASKDHEARDAFWRMVERAKSDPKVGIIAVDDESRFFRDKYLTAAVKGELRKHGVVVYTTTRTADPRTMTGLWQESIEETMAHADNIMRRDATMRGMRGNIRERDPETGWAFKNGGPAPYGWTNKRLHMGNDSRGRPIGRTIWELHPEQAKVRRQILMWRKEGRSITEIRDELNRQGIPPARNALWSHTTVQNMLREDNIWMAAGYSIWNKHYSPEERRQAGRKFKPTSEWVIEPNAHPAIISEEEAREIVAIGRKRRETWMRTRGNERRSEYLLSGDNAYGDPMFVCERCGGRMVGSRIGIRGGTARRYVCSTYNRHGRDYCQPVRIDAEKLEKRVLDYIQKRVLSVESIRATIREANKIIEAEVPNVETPAEKRKARIAEIERQVERAKRAILAGIDEEEWIDTIKLLRAEQQELLAVKDEDEAPVSMKPIPESEAPEMYRRLSEAFLSGDVNKLRQVVQSYVLGIKLDPATRRVVATFAPTWLAGEDQPVSADLVAPTGRVVGAMSEAIIVWSTQP